MFDPSSLFFTDSDGDGSPDEMSTTLLAGKKALQVEPGSPEAKQLWAKIEADAHSTENVTKAKELSGLENAKGMFLGKALVPGPGPNQGDFDFLVAKLVLHDGHTPEVATKIASAVKHRLYGGR